MRVRAVLLALALAPLPGAVAAGCGSSSTTGPHPGNHPPGAACSWAGDCYCWQCACDGVGGPPGAAQLCIDGTCPSGNEACAPSCASAGAKLISSTSVDSCDGVP